MADPQGSDALVLLDRPCAGVARLTLNRPAARNALNSALRQALAEAFDALETDAVSRLPVLRTWKSIADFGKPLIAAVAGPALAGGPLLERRAFELLFDTQDQKEGMRAFAERRAPVFTGL